MRKIAYFAAIGALIALPCVAHAQAAASSSQDQTTAGSSAPAQGDPLAAAARKAKEQKAAQAAAAKPAHVFTNENIPTSGNGISTVGVKPADASAGAAAASTDSSANAEAAWKDKFAKLRQKLDQDTSELAVMQRELGVLNTQNYSDPVQAMQQGYSRSDIQKKTDEISAKQKEVDADKQAIDDAEDDLRKSGGDAGWAR